MMQQSAVVNSYYKAYYLSKAWIELGLVQIKHRGIGFEYVVTTGNSVITDNFFSGQLFSVSTTLSGTASLLSKNFWQGSGCESPYVLSGGESVIVPLFRDVTPGTITQLLTTGMVYENLAQLLDKITIKNISSPDAVTFGLLTLSGEELSDNGIFFKSWSLTTSSLGEFKLAFDTYMAEADRNFANYYTTRELIEKWYKMYFMISNTAQESQSFCLQTVMDSQSQTFPVLPTDTFFLQSQASFGNQRVGLDASYAQPIPSFLFGAYSTFN